MQLSDDSITGQVKGGEALGEGRVASFSVGNEVEARVRACARPGQALWQRSETRCVEDDKFNGPAGVGDPVGECLGEVGARGVDRLQRKAGGAFENVKQLLEICSVGGSESLKERRLRGG